MTSQLVADALMMAIRRGGRPQELLHHSDQGSQYTNEHFQRLLAEQGVTCSMSRAGEVWDNAAVASFFSSLKTVRMERRLYRSRDKARSDVFDCIERFYSRMCRHSTLGHVSPVEFEEAWKAQAVVHRTGTAHGVVPRSTGPLACRALAKGDGTLPLVAPQCKVGRKAKTGTP